MRHLNAMSLQVLWSKIMKKGISYRNINFMKSLDCRSWYSWALIFSSKNNFFCVKFASSSKYIACFKLSTPIIRLYIPKKHLPFKITINQRFKFSNLSISLAFLSITHWITIHACNCSSHESKTLCSETLLNYLKILHFLAFVEIS